jgi:hypothetical protein
MIGIMILRKTILSVAAIMGAGWAAFAQEPNSITGIDLSGANPSGLENSAGFDVSVRENGQAPFLPFTDPDAQAPRRLELTLTAGGSDAPLDVSIAQRTTIIPDENGEFTREGGGAEVRVGRGLVRRDDGRGGNSSTYVFVASDNEALTWRPGARSEFGGRGSALSLRDRVEVGDMAAGITHESNGVEASLAYVEREESTQIGTQSFTQDQSFAGVTVTVRN